MIANDLIGWIAALLVLATFCTKRMIPLRTVAIVSNVAFITYGHQAGLWPILTLHLVMLPINAVRLHQEVTAARSGTGVRKPPVVSRYRRSPVSGHDLSIDILLAQPARKQRLDYPLSSQN